MHVSGHTVKVIGNTVLNMSRLYSDQQLIGIDARGDLVKMLIGNTVIFDARVRGFAGILTSYVYDFQAVSVSFVRNNQIANAETGMALGTAKYQDNLTIGCTTPFVGGTSVESNMTPAAF